MITVVATYGLYRLEVWAKEQTQQHTSDAHGYIFTYEETAKRPVSPQDKWLRGATLCVGNK